MDHYLSSAPWRELAEDYRMRLGEPPAGSVRTIALSELQDEAVCREYVSWLKDYIGAPDMQVAASMLAKRIGYLWIAPILTAMTVHNREVFFPLDRSFLYHPASTEETTFPFLALDGLRSASPPEDRAVWREAVVKENFCGTACAAAADACHRGPRLHGRAVGEYYGSYGPVVCAWSRPIRRRKSTDARGFCVSDPDGSRPMLRRKTQSIHPVHRRG
ncbi:hypothetical protein ACFTAO_02380 [Paenibacillus rhizoplanae]